jgi:hypothetical protein
MSRRAVHSLRAAALWLLCALMLASCAPLFPSEARGPFVGDWRLVQAGWGEAEFTVAGAGITLTSDGETVRGFSGCHSYAFTLTGELTALRIAGPVDAATAPPAGLAACDGKLERFESRYLSALLAADAGKMRNDTLRLTDGTSYLVFTKIPPFPERQLTGKEWRLEGYGETWGNTWTAELVGSPTLRFLGQDRFVGDLGCGSVLGTYRVVRTQVFVVSMQRFGADECLSAFSGQDQLLAEFLDGFRATLTGDHLILTHERLQLLYRAGTPG